MTDPRGHTYTEAFKLECLARHILRKPLDDRRAWLADFEKRNGAAAGAKVKAAVRAEHAKGRA